MIFKFRDGTVTKQTMENSILNEAMLKVLVQNLKNSGINVNNLNKINGKTIRDISSIEIFF